MKASRKDYFKRYNKYFLPNPMSMNQRKLAADALMISVERFIELQTEAMNTDTDLIKVLQNHKILDENGSLV